jgi:peptidoglycan/LPS O-acetylase OafA/YrhL
VDGLILRKGPGRLESAIATLAVIAAFIVASFFHLPTEQMSIRSAGRLWPIALCGIVLVYAALRSRPVTTFLLAPFSQALGHLSFPVFLMHGIIAATVASLLVVMRNSVGPIDEFMALLIATASTLASYAAAPLLVPVEAFTLSFVRRIGRRQPKV